MKSGGFAPAHVFLALCSMVLILNTSAKSAYAMTAPRDSSRDIPDFARVRAAWVPSESWLLARDGRLLDSLRVDSLARRLLWTPLSAISPALQKAVVWAEDRRFSEHAGIDWAAAASAAWSNLLGRPTRGASTLSMQVAGFLAHGEGLRAPGEHGSGQTAQRAGRRGWLDKLSQAFAARRLEQRWTKAQIMEAYLNLAGFRGELQGVAAMSQGLFGKWPEGLNEREAALAAALLRAPNASATAAAHRACAVLKAMGSDENCQTLESFAALSLGRPPRVLPSMPPDYDAPAPHGAAHLAVKLLSAPGHKVRSSLDADLQWFAHRALRGSLRSLSHRGVEDGALVVVDNASGEVLAWVGSSGDLSSAAQVDGVTALRQAGSTLKPLLYALAFERRELTPASLVEDTPLNLDTGNGLYAPQDYAPHYQGWVSARVALAGSLNVPAVKVLARLGPELLQRRLRLAGLNSLKQDGDWYGYSLALGSADVSLLMLANAYRTLANGGRWSALRLSPESAPLPGESFPAEKFCAAAGCEGVFGGLPRRVFTPAAAFLVSDILADRAARATTFGLDSWLATPYWSAVKTGTSKDMRDNWCVGFSSRYTVAVWVGNASGAPMHDVSGVSGAAPIWREVMDRLHSPGAASVPPSPTENLRRIKIRFDPPVEPARQEWFIQGTEMAVVQGAQTGALVRIAYPGTGTIIAIDPDIPPQRQRVPLRATGHQPGLRWRLNDEFLPSARTQPSRGAPLLWRPRPGRHRLVLLDQRLRVLDVSEFEVRALPRTGRQ